MEVKINSVPLRKILTICFWCLAIGYSALTILHNIQKPQYRDCEGYTKQLQGGIRQFGQHKYDIQFCGSWRSDPNGDHVRIQVFSEEGYLLAQQVFVVVWDGGFPEKVSYEDKQIVLNNEDSSSVQIDPITISIPPTTIDWIHARLASFLPLF
jgi:hypothetical protein